MARKYDKKRPPKFDRLLTPDASKEQIECNAAFAVYDRRATEIEQKWGIDQLPGLVSPELAQKYGTTLANLNAALEANNPADVLACVHSALRGIDALDAAATANGHIPNQPDFWECELPAEPDGEPFRFAVVRDIRDWRAVEAKRPDLVIYSLQDIGRALRAYIESPLVVATKKAFPQAQIKTIREPVDWKAGGDTIPF